MLRIFREDADHRPGRTVDSATVRTAFLAVTTLLEVLEIDYEVQEREGLKVTIASEDPLPEGWQWQRPYAKYGATV